MELNALTITCRHLRHERDETLAKMAKQKHAAHAMSCRLRKKLRRMELSNRLLIAMYLTSENGARVLRERVVAETEDAMRELPSLGV